jgi:hypothetical protein
MIINNITLLDYVSSTNGKKYYNTICNNCNKESTRRVDQIKIGKGGCRYCKDLNKKSSIKSVINNLYLAYKNSAKQRKIDFTLTREDFINIIENNCYYCNDEPKESLTSKRRNFTKEKYLHNGIDRKDNSVGYTIDNTLPCCSMCNYMKGKYNIDDFLNKIKKIYILRGERDE